MLRWVLLLAVSSAFGAGYCDLIGTEIYAQDNATTFLGLVSDNPYLSESITNNYGTYGSKYSTSSIFNQYGTFGSPYSSFSPFNPYTTTPPTLLQYDPIAKKYSFVAYLTKNKYVVGSIADPDLLLATLNSGTCNGVYTPPVITKADLIVDSLRAFFSTNKDSLYVSYIVANVGAIASLPFKVAVSAKGSRIDTIAFPAVNPNKYLSDYRGFKIVADTTTIAIWADFFNSTPETNEDNNLAISDFLTPRPTQVQSLGKSAHLQTNTKGFDMLGRPAKLHVQSFSLRPVTPTR